MRLPLALPTAVGRPVDGLCIGLNSLDLLGVVSPFPTQDSKQPLRHFAQLPGGEAATAAVGLSRLGHAAAYIGKFGDDDFGRIGLRSLADEGVATDQALVVQGATSRFAIILVDEASGDRTVLWDRHPALTLEPGDVPDAALAAARVVLVDANDVAAVTDVARRARRLGSATAVDVEHVQPGVDALLREIDVIIAADRFPAAFTGRTEPGAALAALQEASGAALVCVTLGEEGSLARCGGREWHTPAFPVAVVDTTGAGDLFRAGFIAGWLRLGAEAEVAQILRYAGAVASLNCRQLGARTSAPRHDEVVGLLGAEPVLQPLPGRPV